MSEKLFVVLLCNKIKDMATSNFHNVNASHIFACSLENEWDYEDLVSNLESELNNHKDYYDYGKSDPYELRSFPSRSLGSFSNSITIEDDEVEIYVTPVIRSGYYMGCNLDWHVRLYVNGYEDDTYADDARVGVIADEYIEFIENIFEQYSDKLGVTAQFSNGETIYHKI
jgi:hypothetical protein